MRLCKGERNQASGGEVIVRKKALEGGVYILPKFSNHEWLVLVTRSNGIGVLLGYFYNSLDEIGVAKPKLIRMVGDLGVRNGIWKDVAKIDQFTRDEWPIPKFRRVLPGEGPSSGVMVVSYDDNLSGTGGRLLEGAFDELPADGVSGYKAIEVHLERLE